MKTVSLKIEDTTFGETEKILARVRISRNKYINEAIACYNQIKKRQLLEDKLKVESILVQKDSMAVLNDFEKVAYAD